MNRYRYRSTKNQEQEHSHDDDQYHHHHHHHQDLRRKKRTAIALIRNYAIILLLFVGLVCIYTPPRNTTPFSRSESIDNGKKKIIAAAAAAKTTIIACDVSTPYDNVDVAEGTLRITIQNDNHDNNSSIHTQRKGSSAEAFVNLVDAKFYDSTYTFRVIKGFVVQWGFRGGTQSSDKNGDGDGDRTKFDAASKRIREADTTPTSSNILNNQDNNRSGLLSNVRGTITMISGSTGQVFINLGNNARLDKEGTIPFGVLDEASMMLADKIYTGYKGGQGQIKAIISNKIPTQFPKMNRIESCYRLE